MATSQDFVNWICGDELIPEFLQYLFIAEKRALLRFASGAVHPTIYYPEAKAMHACLPPLPEQQRIVAMLDEAFAAIATATANAERNVANARELFESQLRSTLTQAMLECELVTIGAAFKTTAGGTPLRSESAYFDGGTVPWIMSGEVGQREIHSCEKRVTDEGLASCSARLLPIDSVLVAMYGATAGQVGVLKFEACTNQAVCAIHPHDDFVPDFVYFALLRQQRDLIASAVGNAQPNLSQIKIRKVEIPAPLVKDQRRVAELLDNALAVSEQLACLNTRRLAVLAELKQSILHRAFTGELTAAPRAADRALSEAGV